MNIDLTIVIVNYNVKDLLLQCLHSIYKRQELNVEVIVVDNNSSDDSLDAVTKKFPQVSIISNKYNAGFSQANNQGIKVARGEYILLLNPDTEIKGAALSLMVNFLRSNDHINILGPKLLNTDGSMQISSWPFPRIIDVFLESFLLSYFIKGSKPGFYKSFETDALSGAALLFHSHVPEKIGLLDSDLFWMEDIDYCYRSKTQTDKKNFWFRDAEIIHHSGQSSKKNYHVAVSNQLLSKLKFYRKHKSRLSVIVVGILVFFHILIRIIIFGILNLFFKKYKNYIHAYMHSLKKFYKYIVYNDKTLL